MLRLVKCVKLRSLVGGDEGFCRVIDFAYVFVEFVLEFVVEVSKLYVVYHVEEISFELGTQRVEAQGAQIQNIEP